MVRRTVLACFIAFSFCSVHPPAASFSSETNTYNNEVVGLSITFPKEWNVGDSRRNAPEILKSQFPAGSAKPDRSPLFLGQKENSQAFVRCLCEKTETNIEDYFALLWEANSKTVAGVRATRISKDRRYLQWTYEVDQKGLKILFYETVVQRPPYMVRLGFWTIAPLFTKYRNEFKAITGSLRQSAGAAGAGPESPVDSAFVDTVFAYIPLVKDSPAVAAGDRCGNGGHPALWKVSRDGATVYLFGSIHFGSEEFYPFHEKIESAFASSDNLVVEVNSRSDSAQIRSKGILASGLLDSGRTLKTVLSAPVYKKLNKTLNEMGLPVDRFLHFKPWLVTITLSVLQVQAAGYVSEYGVETYFLDKARERNKKILELETIAEQVRLLSSLNGESYLAYTMLEGAEAKARLKRLCRAWICGDQAVMKEILLKDYSAEISGYSEIMAELFTRRNVKMADRIEQYLKQGGTYFVTVGTGHLISKESVVELLQKKGYRVELQ